MISYDLNGNTLNDGTNAYVWDARNRLVSANSNNASFAYDALGRRATKTFMSTTTSFVYDGPNPVQEQQDSTVTANLLTGGVDERFQRTDSTGCYSYLTDALGSTEALTDSTGAEQATYNYSAYGSFSITGSTTNSYDYTGRESDGLGLHYYRARYYNPAIDRFISEDPIGLAAGTNQYAYVGDTPLNYIDPLGMDRQSGGPWGWNPWSPWSPGSGGPNAPNNPWNNCRTDAVLSGLTDVGLGALKLGLGFAAAPETGGLSLYEAWSGFTNLVSAGGELYGGISGNLGTGEKVANYASSLGTVSGTATLVISGNAQYGADASTLEGLVTLGITGGLTSTGTIQPSGPLDTAVNLLDNGVGAAALAAPGGCQ